MSAESYVRDRRRVPPEFAVILDGAISYWANTHGSSYGSFRIGNTPIKISGAWWERIRNTSIWNLNGTVMVSSKYSWDYDTPRGKLRFAVLGHEFFHSWQYHRYGRIRMWGASFQSLLLEAWGRITRQWHKYYWHAQAREREAGNFQLWFMNEYLTDEQMERILKV